MVDSPLTIVNQIPVCIKPDGHQESGSQACMVCTTVLTKAAKVNKINKHNGLASK